MLLTIGHDDAQLVCVGIDGLQIPIQGTAIQDGILLKIAARAKGHSQSLAPPLSILNALPHNAGSRTQDSSSMIWTTSSGR